VRQYESWTERLNSELDAEIDVVPKDFAGMKAGQSMVRPTALMVETHIRSVLYGESLSVAELRKRLAKEDKVDVTCPITVGFHLRTIAEAAHESLVAGANIEDITPFWRVMDSRTPSTSRLSFGTELIKEQREIEGLKF